MVKYKPGIEYTGIRGALHSLCGLAHRHRLLRRALIALPFLVLLCVVGNYTSGRFEEYRYCRHCGHQEWREEIRVLGLTWSTEQVTACDSFITRWFAKQGMPCPEHDYRVAQGVSFHPIGTSTYGDKSRVCREIFEWDGGMDIELPVLNDLTEADPKAAQRLVDRLLGPDGEMHWEWLNDEGGMYLKYGNNPQRVLKSFHEFESTGKPWPSYRPPSH
jgi:hypothetical protein